MPGLVGHRCETSVNLWGQFTWLKPAFAACSALLERGKPLERAGRKATDLPEFLQ